MLGLSLVVHQSFSWIFLLFVSCPFSLDSIHFLLSSLVFCCGVHSPWIRTFNYTFILWPFFPESKRFNYAFALWCQKASISGLRAYCTFLMVFTLWIRILNYGNALRCLLSLDQPPGVYSLWIRMLNYGNKLLCLLPLDPPPVFTLPGSTPGWTAPLIRWSGVRGTCRLEVIVNTMFICNRTSSADHLFQHKSS